MNKRHLDFFETLQVFLFKKTSVIGPQNYSIFLKKFSFKNFRPRGMCNFGFFRNLDSLIF